MLNFILEFCRLEMVEKEVVAAALLLHRGLSCLLHRGLSCEGGARLRDHLGREKRFETLGQMD